MTDYIRNRRRLWDRRDRKALATLARQNTPPIVIGYKLGRTTEAVRKAASRLGISLKPRNQKSYANWR